MSVGVFGVVRRPLDVSAVSCACERARRVLRVCVLCFSAGCLFSVCLSLSVCLCVCADVISVCVCAVCVCVCACVRASGRGEAACLRERDYASLRWVINSRVLLLLLLLALMEHVFCMGFIDFRFFLLICAWV